MTRKEKTTIVIAGSLAQKPCQGGHTWQFLQYLLGLKKLGYDVLFLDRIEPEMCFDADGKQVDFEKSVNLSYFLRIMKEFGLSDQFSLTYNQCEKVIGQSRAQTIETLQRAPFLLNTMGFLTDPELLAAAEKKVFLDTDPGFGQMWCDLGWANLFAGHDEFVTIAENIGKPECKIPTCSLPWKTWRQPVLLDRWQPLENSSASDRRPAWTSIGSWRGPYGSIEHHGVTYGLRAHEFRKFFKLPDLTQEPFEVALDIHTAEKPDLLALSDNHWSLSDPKKVACDPWVYRDYIQNSKAEFMATKGMYVHTHSGWFSERSICYLAAGKPVLAQNTGLGSLLPIGLGIVLFDDIEQAQQGVAEIAGNYTAHCKAAREIAVEHFDSSKVLMQLLRTLNVA